MNYLTTYYKNLCEDLQTKIDLLEAKIRSAAELRDIAVQEYEKAAEEARLQKRISGREPYLSTDEIGGLVKTKAAPYYARAQRREDLLKKATSMLGDVAQSGDVETAKQYGDVMADVMSVGPKVAGSSPDSQKILTDVTKKVREMGYPANVPADVAAMRKVIQMGTGKYKAPFPEPPEETMHVTPSHY